jgi:tRNA 2-thiouridine synthesizing protein A
MAETVLRLEGLKCPLPVLRARKALAAAAPGDVVVVFCTDPMAAIDIPVMVQADGAVLEAQAAEGGTLTFRIRKR